MAWYSQIAQKMGKMYNKRWKHALNEEALFIILSEFNVFV